jgi:hypothetical protein
MFCHTSLFHVISCRSSSHMVEWPHRPPPSRWTLADCMTRSPTVSTSRPVALTKSPEMDMMRSDRSSLTLAMKSKLHRASVAQCQQTPRGTVKVQPALLKVAARLLQPQSSSNAPFCRPFRRRNQQLAAPQCCPAAAQQLANCKTMPTSKPAVAARSPRRVASPSSTLLIGSATFMG